MNCAKWFLLISLLCVFEETSGRPSKNGAESENEKNTDERGNNEETNIQEDVSAASDPFENIQATTDTMKEVENAEQESNGSEETVQERSEEETQNTETPGKDEDSTDAMEKLSLDEEPEGNAQILKATSVDNDRIEGTTTDKTEAEQVMDKTVMPDSSIVPPTTAPTGSVANAQVSTGDTATILADRPKQLTHIAAELISVVSTAEPKQAEFTESLVTGSATDIDYSQQDISESDERSSERPSVVNDFIQTSSKIPETSTESSKTAQESLLKPASLENTREEVNAQSLQHPQDSQDGTKEKDSLLMNSQLEQPTNKSHTLPSQLDLTESVPVTTSVPSEILPERAQDPISHVIPVSSIDEAHNKTNTEKSSGHNITATLLTSNETGAEMSHVQAAASSSRISEPPPEVAGPAEELLQSGSDDQDGADLSAMKAFSFDLPIYNHSIHKDLLLNESDWTKELAESTHSDEESTIHDPCTFISENIHRVVGLNVTKEQIHNTLPTFRFLLDSSTEELTTIKEMLLACVEATANKKSNTDPGCQQIRSLISKTCQVMETCKNHEAMIMSKVMERIREVIDSDQLADALLMIRACAGQTYE